MKRKHTKHKWTSGEDEHLASYLKEKKTPKWIQENAFPVMTTSAIKSRIQHLKGVENIEEDSGKKLVKSDNSSKSN